MRVCNVFISSIFCCLLFSCSEVENSSVLVGYDDTSVFITTSSEKIERTISVNGSVYSITEFNVFPKQECFKEVFRIPSVVLTNKGTVIVSCENRNNGKEDKGDIDILLARKEWNSDEWTIRRVFQTNERVGRSMNPVFLNDQKTGRLYLFVCHLLDNTKDADFQSTEEIDFVYKYSDDDGLTWSQEFSLKHLWDTNKYTAILPSSVKGINLPDGTLLLPTMVLVNETWLSGLLINKNGDWNFSSPTYNIGDNECSVYLDKDGQIILDCRTLRPFRRRYVYNLLSDSFEETEPPVFKNSMAVSTEVINCGDYFLMCFPESDYIRRENITLYISKDGIHWEKLFRMMDGLSNGYTGIARNTNSIILCYEDVDIIKVQDVSSMKSYMDSFYAFE